MLVGLHSMQQQGAIALLYQKYAPGILAYVRMHVSCDEDAEDIVVEVFLAAIENSKLQLLAEKEQQMWLWRVARNKVIDRYRRSSRHSSIALEQVENDLYADDHAGPEYNALRQEDYAALHTYLQSLPAAYQEILHLRFGHDLPCREIAHRLGKQENAVRVTLSRGLNLLRRLYHVQRGASRT